MVKQFGVKESSCKFQFQWHDIPEGFSLEKRPFAMQTPFRDPRLCYLTVWTLTSNDRDAHLISTHTWYKHLPLKIPKKFPSKLFDGILILCGFKDFSGLNFKPENWGCFMIRIDLKYTYCWIGWGNTTNSFFNLIQKNFDDFDVCPICVFNTVNCRSGFKRLSFRKAPVQRVGRSSSWISRCSPFEQRTAVEIQNFNLLRNLRERYSSPGSLTAKASRKIGAPKPLIGKYRWWQLKYFYNFHPECLGKWCNLTSIFFKWVGSTTNKESIIF